MPHLLPLDYRWLTDLGLIPGVEHPARHCAYGAVDQLINTPGTDDYLPPLIPSSADWLKNVQRLVGISAHALVADIWTQLLILKRDYKEKPIYLFWDDEIPKPNPLTSLIWLLTCETWPMPNHFNPAGNEWEHVFPRQTFLLPQSTPYGYSSSRPDGFAIGKTAFVEKSLTGLLTQAMHRDDRANMEKVDEKPVIHRPQVGMTTSYQQHTRGGLSHNIWTANGGWPRISTKAYDQNMAAYEWLESEHHHAAIANLRASVMHDLLTIPGLPTHRDNIHRSAGAWIRNWSEIGVFTHGMQTIDWTPDCEPVRLNSGNLLRTVPNAAPRVWFGWTHIGPKYELELGGAGAERRVASDSELWANAYLAHRATALKMLFTPESIDINQMLRDAASARAKLLERAGRLIKGGDSATKPQTQPNAMANAFAALMANAPTESKE